MTKRQRIRKMRQSNDDYFKSLGWTPSKKESPHSIPCYKTQSNLPKLSDAVPRHGTKTGASTYTGDEILGIATMHKSNAIPIRKDSKHGAKDVSRMRRG